MSRPAWHRTGSRGARLAEAALWTGASLMVLTVHVGGAVWLLREQPVIAADAAPPAAIMIEFAEAPEAASTEEDEITPDPEDADASTPAEEVEAPEEPEEAVEEQVEPEPEAEPVEEVTEEASDETEPVEEKDDDPLEHEAVERPENVVVPLPRQRPAAPPRREVRKKQPRPQQRQAASQVRRQAQVRVQQSSRTAARQTSSGVSAASAAGWRSRLMAHLERRKRYPSGARMRGEQGIAHVRFTIDAAGNVQSVALARSSGHPELDNEVLSLVRRASPVPAPPPGMNRTITAPVRFSTR